MAKCKPVLIVFGIEEDTGYRLDAMSGIYELDGRFYSDLRPVPDDANGRTQKEFEGSCRRRRQPDGAPVALELLPVADKSKASMRIYLAALFTSSNIDTDNSVRQGRDYSHTYDQEHASLPISCGYLLWKGIPLATAL
jgi:hypothetical protein